MNFLSADQNTGHWIRTQGAPMCAPTKGNIWNSIVLLNYTKFALRQAKQAWEQESGDYNLTSLHQLSRKDLEAQVHSVGILRSS